MDVGRMRAGARRSKPFGVHLRICFRKPRKIAMSSPKRPNPPAKSKPRQESGIAASPYASKKAAPDSRPITRPDAQPASKSAPAGTRQKPRTGRVGDAPSQGQADRSRVRKTDGRVANAGMAQSRFAPAPIVHLPAPCAVVSRRASESLRRDHLWVYASDVEQIKLTPGIAPALVPVVDNRGIPLGTALYSPASQITLRMVSREVIGEEKWQTLLAERMRTAIRRRSLCGPCDSAIADQRSG